MNFKKMLYLEGDKNPHIVHQKEKMTGKVVS